MAENGAPTQPGEDQPGWAAPGGTERAPEPGSGAPATPPTAPTAPVLSPPSWPPPPPEGAAGAPVQARRGKTWLVVLLVALGLTLAAAIVGTLLFVDRSLPPYDAAQEFVEHVEDREFSAAFNQQCSADRNDGSTESLRSLFSGILEGSNGLTANPLSVDREGSRATVDFSVSYRGEREDKSYELHLRDENGDWKPCPGDELRN